MDIDKARAVLGKTDTDYQAASPVPKGLIILMDFSDDVPCRFEHDQMWAGNFEETIKKMGVGAVARMAVLGWFEDEESWSHS